MSLWTGWLILEEATAAVPDLAARGKTAQASTAVRDNAEVAMPVWAVCGKDGAGIGRLLPRGRTCEPGHLRSGMTGMLRDRLC